MPVADFGGVRGERAPHWAPKFFRKIWQNCMLAPPPPPPGELAPPPRRNPGSATEFGYIVVRENNFQSAFYSLYNLRNNLLKILLKREMVRSLQELLGGYN